MKRFASLLFLLSACDVAVTPAAPRLSAEGLGHARIGASLEELKASLSTLKVPANVDPASCFYASLEDEPGVLLMMIDGELQRIDVRAGSAMATQDGISIGDPATKVHDVYGAKVEVLPHKYDYAAGAQYLTVTTDDKRGAIRFNTAGGKVASFQAGNAEQVQWVEGCG